jgi:hypothetical protein
MKRAQAAVDNCRRSVRRNEETLSHIDFGLKAAKFTGERLKYSTLALEHYHAALTGRRGSVSLAAKNVHILTEKVREMIHLLQDIQNETGACGAELSNLNHYENRLNALHETLNNLSESSALPSPDSLGMG